MQIICRNATSSVVDSTEADMIIDLDAVAVDSTRQQVASSSGTTPEIKTMAEESGACLKQPDQHSIASLPSSILILGYHVGLLDIQQLESARTRHPLTNINTVGKIKRAVAVALHPDKVGVDAQNKYSDFNARVDELLKPSDGEEGWQKFQQILNTEADEAEEYLRHQMQNRQ